MPPNRPGFFPRESTTFAAFEVSAWRARSLSSIFMGAATGVVLHLLRAVAMTHRAGAHWVYLGVTFTAGISVLFGMLALHLANFPVRRWPPRVLAFVAAEWAAETLTSVVLVALGREPLGTTGRAGWADVPAIAVRTLATRAGALVVFALVLAGVVQLVRSALGRRAHRHTS